MTKMIKRLTSLLVVMGLCSMTSIAVGQGTDKLEPYPGLEPFIDGLVDSQMKLLDIPAVTVSIVKDGKLIFAKGYGTADFEEKRPVDAETSLFRIGSTSKLFTWTSVMQQVERGNLDLDTDVNKYLKTFQIPDTFDEPITLRHILTHTAGFEEGALGYLIQYTKEGTLPLAEAMAKYVPARINPPGKYSSYSNYATALAGLIVQNVTGVPFNDYVKQNIFDPLGMEHATFDEPLPEHLQKDMTTAYKRENGVQTPQPFEFISSFAPAGAVSASAVDMSKFMLAHLNEGRLGEARILKTETAKQMHSTIFRPDERLGGMAHGFYEERLNGHRLIGHGGDTMFFHTNMLLDDAEDLGIFVSYMTPEGSKGRNEFIPAFYNYYYPEELKSITPSADFDARADKYAGSYIFWRRNESGFEKSLGLLSNGLSVAPTGEGTLLIAGLFEPRQYVEIGENLFRQVDGTNIIAFGEDENGVVKDLFIDQYPFMAARRAPAFEGSLFKMILPLASLALFLTVWVGWLYRRKEFKTMQKAERQAIALSLGTSAAFLLFVVSLGIIMVAQFDELFVDIPVTLTLTLILPLVGILLTAGMVYFAVRVWKDKFWRLGRRIHYTLVTLGAVYMVIFCWYWNMLGFQYY
ncbi:serine hydrolase domain-containing protein [Emcibacter sp.]|uniref:serine hydrolase domain-containing protein n=1 Tax=Emcibacter sp. TaxID=1979954 RepID=UPI003A951FEE